MKIPNWVRKYVPHPSYGNWCGAKNTHEFVEDAPPIDHGDKACQIHDFELRDATEAEKHIADAKLWKAWKNYKPKGLYGRLYRRGVLIVFKNKYCK